MCKYVKEFKCEEMFNSIKLKKQIDKIISSEGV